MADRIPLLKQIGEEHLRKRDTEAIVFFDELLTVARMTKDNLLLRTPAIELVFTGFSRMM